jgi:hypothetical protein
LAHGVSIWRAASFSVSFLNGTAPERDCPGFERSN